MGFDADAWRAEHEPWTFTTRGRTYVASPVSVPVLQRFFTMTQGADFATQEREIERVLRVAFPWRPSFQWRGDPVKLILAMEPAARRSALADFFGRIQGTPAVPATSGMS